METELINVRDKRAAEGHDCGKRVPTFLYVQLCLELVLLLWPCMVRI
jgi:hypothetical protein